MVRLVVILTLLLSGCAAELPNAYMGKDAGHVLIGIGGVSAMRISSYTLFFRRIEDRHLPTAEQARGRFEFAAGFTHIRDYKTSSEAGVVQIYMLPPGQYEVFSYRLYVGSLLGETYYTPKEPFSIPFTVTAGNTTYLGNYQANSIDGSNIFGEQVMKTPYFLISARPAAEYEIAKRVNPSLPAPSISAVPDMSPGPTMQITR